MAKNEMQFDCERQAPDGRLLPSPAFPDVKSLSHPLRSRGARF